MFSSVYTVFFFFGFFSKQDVNIFLHGEETVQLIDDRCLTWERGKCRLMGKRAAHSGCWQIQKRRWQQVRSLNLIGGGGEESDVSWSLYLRQTWCRVPTIRQQALFDKRDSNWTTQYKLSHKHPFGTDSGTASSSLQRHEKIPSLSLLCEGGVARWQKDVHQYHLFSFLVNLLSFCQPKSERLWFFLITHPLWKSHWSFFLLFFFSICSFSSVQCSCPSPRPIMAPTVPTAEYPFSSGDPCQSYTKPSSALLSSLWAVNTD